jgi:hypothetical protein
MVDRFRRLALAGSFSTIAYSRPAPFETLRPIISLAVPSSERNTAAGVNRVWVVYPDQLEIHDHDSLSSSRVLDRNQSLDRGGVLPGFQLPLKELLTEHFM